MLGHFGMKKVPVTHQISFRKILVSYLLFRLIKNFFNFEKQVKYEFRLRGGGNQSVDFSKVDLLKTTA